MEGDFARKTIVVTGATSGIGLAVALELAKQGASVIGVGRSAERCKLVERQVQAVETDGYVVFLTADLSLQSQIRSLAAEIRRTLVSNGQNALDGLINNAATFTYWMTLTSEGFEQQWAVNYLSAFLLTHELLPLLQAAQISRVVTVSSDSHFRTQLKWDDIQLRRHYNGLWAYKQTKLADVLFTAELNRRLGMLSPVKAFAADPGLVKTDIGLKSNPGIVGWIWERRRASGITAEQAAKGIVYLVAEPSIQTSTEIYWKHGVSKSASRTALDENEARRLWALSEQMCGISAESA